MSIVQRAKSMVNAVSLGVNDGVSGTVVPDDLRTIVPQSPRRTIGRLANSRRATRYYNAPMSKSRHVSETPATQFLRRHGVTFGEHPYDYVEHGGTEESARQLGVDEHHVVKTLVMEDEHGKPLIVLMHGDRTVSTKNLARQIGAKRVEPCKPEVANRHSGYLIGGTSPFGTRKSRCRCTSSRVSSRLEQIWLNGGRRGFLVSIEPAVLTALAGGEAGAMRECRLTCLVGAKTCLSRRVVRSLCKMAGCAGPFGVSLFRSCGWMHAARVAPDRFRSLQESQMQNLIVAVVAYLIGSVSFAVIVEFRDGPGRPALIRLGQSGRHQRAAERQQDRPRS